MRRLISVFRGRRYEEDEPSTEVTVSVQGAVLTQDQMADVIRDSVLRYTNRDGREPGEGVTP